MEKSCLCFIPYLSLLHLLLASFGMGATDITSDQNSLLSLKDHITSDPYQFLANNWSVGAASVCDWIGVTCGSRHRRVIGLNISNMGLTGTITPHLGNLSFLVSLNLSANNFFGNLPNDLSHLHLLQVLDFTSNNFSGNIPPWFGSLQRLRVLSLEENNFTGFIPPTVFNLSNLEELLLSQNSLQGPIPVEFGNLHSLKLLIISANQLSGFVPTQIFNISSLEVISIADNMVGKNNLLSGSIPHDVCDNLQGLRFLDLSEVKLYGPILSILSNCSQLQCLALDDTNFSGVLPKEIGKLNALEELYLGNCNLTELSRYLVEFFDL